MPDPLAQILAEAERHGCRPELVAALNLADDFANTFGKDWLERDAYKATWLLVLSSKTPSDQLPLQLLTTAAAHTVAIGWHHTMLIEGVIRRTPIPDDTSGLNTEDA